MESASKRLARELAHRIELERPKGTAVGACVHSFQMLIDGLDCYQNFLHEGKLQHLDQAELHFRGAIVHSPRYAAAYHNLGIAKSEKDRVCRDLRLPISSATSAEANLWRQAINLDPAMAWSRFQLTRSALIQGSQSEALYDRTILIDNAVHSARQALNFPSGEHPMERTLAEYWLGISLLRYGKEGELLDRSGKDRISATYEAIGHLRRAERNLSDERARRLIIEGDETAVAPLASRIASVINEQVACRLLLAELEDKRKAHHLKKAERGIRVAIRWRQDDALLHRQHGRILEASSRPSDAFRAYATALQCDPHNREALKAAGGILSEITSDEHLAKVAADFFIIATHQDPYDPDPWLALGQYFQSLDKMPEAIALAGVGFALAPADGNVREQMRNLYMHWASPMGGASGQQYGAEAGAAFYRELAEKENSATFDQEGSPNSLSPIRDQWVAAWCHVNSATVEEADQVAALKGCLEDIEDLRSQWSDFVPEMRLTSWQIGSLHRRLATLLPSSDEERMHRRRAVDCLISAAQLELPGKRPAPRIWRCELADAQAELGDAYKRIQVANKAEGCHEDALKSYTEIVNQKPISGFFKGDNRVPTVLQGDPPRLPVQARALAGRAEVSAAMGRPTEAATDCYDALHLAPLYAYPRFTLARIYRELGQYDAALVSLCRLIELDPPGADRVRCRVELARTYRMKAEGMEREQQRELLSRALDELLVLTREPFPKKTLDVELQEEIADLYHLLGRREEEISSLSAYTGQADQSDDGRLHARIADLLLHRAHPEEIEHQLVKAQSACMRELERKIGTDDERRLRDDAVTLATRIALFYADQRIKLDEARYYAEGARIHARGPTQLAICEDAYGWVAYQEGDPLEAIQHLEIALRYSGGDAQQWAHLALALEAKADLPRFRRMLAVTLEVKSILPHIRKELALAIEDKTNPPRFRRELASRNRDLDRAKDIWQHVIEQFPSSCSAALAREHLDHLPTHRHMSTPLIHSDQHPRLVKELWN
ncbi:hypothetical protein [Streptomyces griseosporeus]|uniref:hypothetical protein n=1 Tax=Streptomyces griseosporeus TaxID=1910 RepID=UPI00378AEBCB